MNKTSISLTISKILILGTLFLGSKAFADPQTQAYRANYDSVWKGALIALSKYPLEKNDKSSGEITTTMIQGEEVFKPFNRTLKSNEHYKLSINLEKRKLRGQEIVVVKIEKMPTLKGDFMNEDLILKSDGIEESVILYRISREIVIDRAVEKLFE